jgi:PAS domain S-box-containing protein
VTVDKGSREISLAEGSQHQLRLISAAVKQSTEGVAVIDLGGHIIFLNRAWARMHGYDQEDLVGKHISVFHSPEQMPAVEAAIRQGRETGEFRGEMWHVRRDGTVFPTSMHNTVIRDDAGNPIAMVGTARDLTEREEAEKALRESEKRYRTILDGSTEGILVADLETMAFTYANPAVCKMLGYTRDELLQLSTRDIHPDEDLERVISIFQAQSRNEMSTAESVPCLRKDGTVFYANINAASMVIDGRPCNVGFFSDVTAHMRADQEIKKFKTIADQASYGAAISDLEGDLIYVNQSFAEMHGGSPEDFIGRNLSTFHNEDQMPRVDELNERLRREERFISEEVMHVRRDGTVFPALMHAAIIKDADGEPYLLSATAIDITEHKRMEEERRQLEEHLRHSQKMDAVGQLAAGVAHEFNNLLVGIIGNAELVARSAGVLPERVRTPIEDIRRSGERAAALTEQLLMFSKKRISYVTVFDINRTVAQAEHMLRRLIGPNMTMKVTGETDPCLIRADEAELEQILTNLVLNARDAMSDDGTVTIRTANVEINDDQASQSSNLSPGPHVELSVTDTGCGMPEERVERIFEPFFTTKSDGQGAGLGLATVFANVERVSGHITVESRPGEGTTFHIYFPRADGDTEAEATAAEPPADEVLCGGETILVCDDEDVALRSFCWRLESRGYSVLAAESGRRALELAATHEGPIALLLTDVIMPEMNGRELAEQITRKRPETQVIYMSGYASDILETDVREDESFVFLQKPSTSEALFRSVREAIDRRRRDES